MIHHITGVAEEGNSVSRGRACGRSQQLNAVTEGGATEEAGLRDDALQFTGLNIAKQHNKATLGLQTQRRKY